MRLQTLFRVEMTVAVALALGLAALPACKGSSGGASSSGEAGTAANAKPKKTSSAASGKTASAKSAATANAGAAKGAKASDEKSKTPPPEPKARATLQVLIHSGGERILSVREERAAIFDLFRRIDAKVVKPALPAIQQVQAIPWVEDPAELRKFPERLAAAVDALLPLIAKNSSNADELLTKVKKLDEENESGKHKHSARKIEKMEKLGLQHRKLASALGLLLRSLFDEAKLYAHYGSRALRADLRKRLAKFKPSDIPHDRARKSFVALLRELGVDGADKP